MAFFDSTTDYLNEIILRPEVQAHLKKMNRDAAYYTQQMETAQTHQELDALWSLTTLLQQQALDGFAHLIVRYNGDIAAAERAWANGQRCNDQQNLRIVKRDNGDLVFAIDPKTTIWSK